MPSTIYNIQRVLNRAPSYTEEEVLQTFDELQKIVYSQESEQTMKYDSSTGMPPYIETQDEVYEYDCPSDCRRTASVFTEEVLRRSYSRTNERAYFQNGYDYRGRQYLRVLVRSIDARPQSSTVGKVVFPFNPGDTTTKFFHQYWISPPDMTDVTDQLVIPEHVHFLFRRLAIYVLTTEQYGDIVIDDPNIMRGIKRIRTQLNAGAQMIEGRTPIRPENQDYI